MAVGGAGSSTSSSGKSGGSSTSGSSGKSGGSDKSGGSGKSGGSDKSGGSSKSGGADKSGGSKSSPTTDSKSSSKTETSKSSESKSPAASAATGGSAAATAAAKGASTTGSKTENSKPSTPSKATSTGAAATSMPATTEGKKGPTASSTDTGFSKEPAVRDSMGDAVKSGLKDAVAPGFRSTVASAAGRTSIEADDPSVPKGTPIADADMPHKGGKPGTTPAKETATKTAAAAPADPAGRSTPAATTPASTTPAAAKGGAAPTAGTPAAPAKKEEEGGFLHDVSKAFSRAMSTMGYYASELANGVGHMARNAGRAANDVLVGGGKVLDAIRDIPFVGGFASMLIHANPYVMGFDVARLGAKLVQGQGSFADVRDIAPLLSAVVGLPVGTMDAVAGAADAVVSFKEGKPLEALGTVGLSLAGMKPREVNAIYGLSGLSEAYKYDDPYVAAKSLGLIAGIGNKQTLTLDGLVDGTKFAKTGDIAAGLDAAANLAPQGGYNKDIADGLKDGIGIYEHFTTPNSTATLAEKTGIQGPIDQGLEGVSQIFNAGRR